MATTARSLISPAQCLAEWRACPPKQVRDCFGATPDPWQDKVLEAFPTTKRMSLKACAGPGKSTVLAWLILCFLSTRLFPKCAATSITWPNLRDNLWAEIAKWLRRSPWLSESFTWTATKVFSNDHPEEWWASARTWDRSADPDTQGQTLSGLHADSVLAIADETGGMPTSVVASAEGVLATGTDSHLVISGNPTHLSGPLYDAEKKERALWSHFDVTGDPDRPDRAPRVNIDWAREMIVKYGRQSAFVRSKVLGLFPRRAADTVVGLDQFEDAVGRVVDPTGEPLAHGLRVLGVDVARFGDDLTVVCKRDGEYLDGFEEWGGKDTVETATKVLEIARRYKADLVRVDDIGVGGGVTDQLNAEDGITFEVEPINVSTRSYALGPDGNPIYFNLKTELNMSMREDWFGPGRIGIDPEVKNTSLEAECTDIRYGFDRGDKVLRVERKEDYKKRHAGASPDYWDATVLAFARTYTASDIVDV